MSGLVGGLLGFRGLDLVLRVFGWSFYLKIAGFFRAVLFSVSMFLVFMSIKIRMRVQGWLGFGIRVCVFEVSPFRSWGAQALGSWDLGIGSLRLGVKHVRF